MEVNESLFLVNIQSTKATEVIFEENYKTNNEALLGLEVSYEPNLIRRHYRGCYIDYGFKGRFLKSICIIMEMLKNWLIIFFLLNAYSDNIDKIESKLNFLIGEIESVFAIKLLRFYIDELEKFIKRNMPKD